MTATKLPTVTSYGEYSGDNYGVNTLQVDIGPLRLYYSYKTVVAFHVTGSPLVVRKNDWGTTTGKHLNWIDGGNAEDKAARISGDEFESRLTTVLGGFGLL